jgi:hypothetical protein
MIEVHFDRIGHAQGTQKLESGSGSVDRWVPVALGQTAEVAAPYRLQAMRQALDENVHVLRRQRPRWLLPGKLEPTVELYRLPDRASALLRRLDEGLNDEIERGTKHPPKVREHDTSSMTSPP